MVLGCQADTGVAVSSSRCCTRPPLLHACRAIKVYPQGKMSQHINNLKVGETLDVKVRGRWGWCVVCLAAEGCMPWGACVG